MNTTMQQPPGYTEIENRCCPICEGPADTHWCSHEFTYGTGDDAVELTADLPFGRCEACDFEFLDFDGERCKTEAVCKHLGVLSPWEIKAIRLHYEMSRAEFARLSGLGEATLARWENGILTQNRANDRYLRLIAQPGGMRRLQEVALAPDSAIKPAERSRTRFRVISITSELRKKQQLFQLRRVA